jgi:hypothetical protein
MVVRDVHFGCHETLKRDLVMSIEEVLHTAHVRVRRGRDSRAVSWGWMTLLFDPIRRAREDQEWQAEWGGAPFGDLALGRDALTLVKPALRTALDKIDIWERIFRSTDSKYS